MNKIAASFWIAIKIWLFAVLFHTVIGTIILAPDDGSLLLFIFLYGALIAGMFSLPIILIVAILLIIISRKKYSFTTCMVIICATGITAAIVASWIFFKYFGTDPFNFLYFTAPSSGVLAILIQAKAIKNLIRQEIDLDEFLKTEKQETEIAQ